MKNFFSQLFRSNNDDSAFRPLNIDERDMIKGVVELSDTNVKEIMVPRIDVVSLSTDTDEESLIRKVIESGHSRFPIYQETIDNVIGIVYVKDIMARLIRKQSAGIKEISRNAYFVPESMKLNVLLKEMKRRRVHIAVVVDEYGGMSGIVCMEDILEEIIGDIQDEFDNETEDIIKIGEGVYLCDARVSVSDLNEQINVTLPEDDFDTLGGYVFDLFGKIPVKFEKVEKDSYIFIIQEMDGHKIRSIKLLISREGNDAKE
ncbi:MAG: hemolysin family protein [Salinispira sp.]